MSVHDVCMRACAPPSWCKALPLLLLLLPTIVMYERQCATQLV